MQENTITQLIYLSSATGHLAADDLKQILKSSVRNNGADSITGLLIYHEGAFFRFWKGQRRLLRSVLTVLRQMPVMAASFA